ncbi:MAG: septal ring lytic transglycosylase RlpA family protein [Terriglobales bacterium]
MAFVVSALSTRTSVPTVQAAARRPTAIATSAPAPVEGLALVPAAPRFGTLAAIIASPLPNLARLDPPGPRFDRLPYQVGIASWYGPYFQGKETTSGEPFDMYAMTAAHRELPLGTRVRVTNLENDRSVILRINDRGPVPMSRIIDVSYGAAQALHFIGEGLVSVRLDVLKAGKSR